MKSKFFIVFTIIRAIGRSLRRFIVRGELLLLIVVELLLGFLLLANAASLLRTLVSHTVLRPETLREVALTDSEIVAVHKLATLIKLVYLFPHQLLNGTLLLLRTTRGLVGEDWQSAFALRDIKVN